MARIDHRFEPTFARDVAMIRRREGLHGRMRTAHALVGAHRPVLVGVGHVFVDQSVGPRGADIGGDTRIAMAILCCVVERAGVQIQLVIDILTT